MFSRYETFGFLAAIIAIVVMGVIVFKGPFHKVNKPPSAAAAAPPAQTVKIVNNAKTIGAYNPRTATVKLGQAVSFTNVSSIAHTVTADDGSFNSGNLDNNGQTWTFRPSKAGTFKYTCIYHPNMHGTLVVQG